MTTFSPEQLEALSAKLDKGHVKEREQSGRRLSYIEGWHAISEANRIFGFDAWNRETLDIRCVAENPRKIGRQNPRDGFGVSYIARVRVTIGDIIREGVGSGHGIDVDLGLAHESAIKEAETDAMKRALMTFGNPFGLALYDKTQANVDAGDTPQNDEPRTRDRRSEVGRQQSENDTRVSAAHQKRCLDLIEQELLDTRTERDVKKLVDAWGDQAEREKWSNDYWSIAMEKFRSRLKALREANQADDFPGDAPPASANTDLKNNAYAKAVMAG